MLAVVMLGVMNHWQLFHVWIDTVSDRGGRCSCVAPVCLDAVHCWLSDGMLQLQLQLQQADDRQQLPVTRCSRQAVPYLTYMLQHPYCFQLVCAI